MKWTPALLAQVEEMWNSGKRRTEIAREFGVTANSIAGLTTRLNLHPVLSPEQVRGLPANHPAVVRGRTLFTSRVLDVPRVKLRRRLTNEGGHILISGRNQRKLGAVVTKGPWAGMPIYSLTLEERATCPSDCANWLTCFGNTMHRASRFRHGVALETRLEMELAELQHLHQDGFVIRLHLLGNYIHDFSLDASA